MRILVLIMLLLVINTRFTQAQQVASNINEKRSWYKIGETSVEFQESSDAIVIQSDDRFAAVKFVVVNAPVDLIEMEVIYEMKNQETANEKIRVNVPGESKIIDLNNGEWKLKKIIFMYTTEPINRDKKGHVEIWGISPGNKK
ncbi:MAG TPA: hypothetical protein VK177_12565 [Flavobacteriales bacterium]|nr:hypothetical protein [Flavobacteriales bacterium]